jgi:hypothetical protein
VLLLLLASLTLQPQLLQLLVELLAVLHVIVVWLLQLVHC